MSRKTNPSLGDKYIDNNGVTLEYMGEGSWVNTDSYRYAQLKRKLAYPPIGDQLDMLFHAGLGGDMFQASIQSVKDSIVMPPKPEQD